MRINLNSVSLSSNVSLNKIKFFKYFPHFIKVNIFKVKCHVKRTFQTMNCQLCRRVFKTNVKKKTFKKELDFLLFSSQDIEILDFFKFGA